MEDLSKDYKAAMRAIELNLGNIQGEDYQKAMGDVLRLKTAHEAMREVNRLVRRISDLKKTGDYAGIKETQKKITAVAKQAIENPTAITNTALNELGPELQAAVRRYLVDREDRNTQIEYHGTVKYKGDPIMPTAATHPDPLKRAVRREKAAEERREKGSIVRWRSC